MDGSQKPPEKLPENVSFFRQKAKERRKWTKIFCPCWYYWEQRNSPYWQYNEWHGSKFNLSVLNNFLCVTVHIVSCISACIWMCCIVMSIGSLPVWGDEVTSWVPGHWSGAGLRPGHHWPKVDLRTPSDTSFQFQFITIFSFLKMPCKIESCKQV